MWRVTVIVPLTCLVQAHAHEVVDSMLNLPLYTKLDSTVLGKPGRFAAPSSTIAKDAIHGTQYNRFVPALLPRNKGPLAVPLQHVPQNVAIAALAGHEEEGQHQRSWLTRRASLGAMVSAILAQPKHANAAEAPTVEIVAIPAMKDVVYKTFKFSAPASYVELPDQADRIPGAFTFLANPTGGLAGNSILVVKQPVKNINVQKFGNPKNDPPKAMSDFGSIDDVAKNVIGSEGGELISAQVRKDDKGQEYYTFDYTKSLLGLQRHSLSCLTIIDGIFHALLIDGDANTFDTDEGQALRQTAKSFIVNSLPT